MKSFLGFFLLSIATTGAKELLPVEPMPSESLTAFGYLRRFGIPEAERIRKLEEEYLRIPNRISGGAPSTIGQIPYQAGLLSDIIDLSGNGICGGSLLSATKVLTAAHCWWDGEHRAWRFTIVLGSVMLYSGGTRIQTTAVNMHPDWNPRTIRNDVAMINLFSPVKFSDAISPISLPTTDESFDGEIGIASGFGMVGTNPITINQFLSHVSLNIITNTVCWLRFPAMVQSSNICTSGSGAKSTCRGDSGGPLVVVRNNQSFLVGVTSFGSAFGCTRGAPAVYARVTSFRDFINQNL